MIPPKPGIAPPKDTTTSEPVLEEHSRVFANDPAYRAILQKLRISPGFFKASIIAARIPHVSAADGGGDFSNNLVSYLAPILALFGEQVGTLFLLQKSLYGCADMFVLR